MRHIIAAIASVVLGIATPAIAEWPQAQSPAIPDADGYVSIPGAAVPPDKTQKYLALFDATQAAASPTQLVPALNMLGSELNALAASGVPLVNARFVVVFHGDAMAGILDEAHYQAKFGVSNPNLKVLAQLKKAGVEMFVCGQNLAFDKVDPKGLAPEVRIASDALIVIMTYHRKGYALLSF
jgi:intracellular sulfur oxidation DsrE/DsrF family protein